MKLNFNWKDDKKYHQYCFNCQAEKVSRVYEEGKTFYFCSTCKQKQERSIVIDPAIKWWVDKTGEYWHESSGVFIRNQEGKFLFFERTVFPFALTVPSGHVDSGEDAESAAFREVKEEIGLSIDKLVKISSEDIIGDSCRRGSDAHKWHAYLCIMKKNVEIKVLEEGKKPVWLSLEDALKKDLIYPVRQVISKSNGNLAKG